MLKSLHIKNFALIDDLTIEFNAGLNIITGETGAGKSILIDALLLVLGERASLDLIRQGENKAIVEGVFLLNGSHPVFDIPELADYDSNEGEIIIRREIQLKGTSRCFVNDSPVQASVLKKIGDLLVDFHGQYEHQQLLNKDYHIDFLDLTASVNDLLPEYQSLLSALKELINEYRNFLKKENELKSKLEINRFELSEIKRINPLENEDENIEKEINILEHSELLFNSTNEVDSILYSDDNSVYSSLSAVLNSLNKLAEIDDNFRDYVREIESAIISIDEVYKFTREYNKSVQFDPERIDRIRERIASLRTLIKKYGTVNNALKKAAELEKEISFAHNFSGEIDSLKSSIAKQKSDLASLALKLSKSRKKASAVFESSASSILKTMGIANPVFKVMFHSNELQNHLSPEMETEDLSISINDTRYTCNSKGIDLVEFYISTNKGESPMPLAEIASGGEISRVMLAIKTIIAKQDSMPILVFDEIDTGISGKVAQQVGITMSNLAEHHQIIAITHLPQIASAGSHNIAVVKEELKGRTYIKASVLGEADKIREIAKLISGEKITEASLANARELIQSVNPGLIQSR